MIEYKDRIVEKIVVKEVEKIIKQEPVIEYKDRIVEKIVVKEVEKIIKHEVKFAGSGLISAFILLAGFTLGFALK